jgi:hypothetical protein
MTRAGQRCHHFTVDSILTRTKKFGNSFLCRTISKWNSLLSHVFSPSYSVDSFKRSVKKHLAGQYGIVNG